MLPSDKTASQEGINTTTKTASSPPHLSQTVPKVLWTADTLLSHHCSLEITSGELCTAKETVVYEKLPPPKYNIDLAKNKEKFLKRFFKHPLVFHLPYSLLHCLPADDGDSGILEVKQLLALTSCAPVEVLNQAVMPILLPSSIAYSEPLKPNSGEPLPLIPEPELDATTAEAAERAAEKTDVAEDCVKRRLTLRYMDPDSSKPTTELQLQSIKMRDMIIVRRRLSKELLLRRTVLSRSLSRSPRRPPNQRGIVPRPTSVEGMDGVAAGAATSAAASRQQKQSTFDLSTINPVLVKQAKERVEEAIKKNKIFAVIGPYHHIREGLKRRGWVEKFYKATINLNGGSKPRLTSRSAETPNCLSDDADGDGNDDDQTDLMIAEPERKEFPWEADGGIYGLMARSLKATVPNFIWTLKKSQIDFRFLRKDQIVNHHPKAPFTTKVGLCRHLRMVRWFDDIGPESFFPRCYLLSANEEKRSFIDDYQLTAAMAAIKWACNYYQQPRQPKKRIQRPNMRETDDDTSTYDPQVWNSQCEGSVSDSSSGTISATKAITMALRCCDWYLRSMRHEDLDESSGQFERSVTSIPPTVHLLVVPLPNFQCLSNVDFFAD
uniref:Uncharacterized protein n=1 Tax=Schistocephalus solidus TaxID=70667 RepID=A0A0X3NGQ2_SCHSO